MKHKIKFNDIQKNYKSIKREIDYAIKRVIKNSSFILGEEVENFEKKFCKYLNSKYCAGVSSGTSALFLALKALEIKKGDEVITTPLSWISTSEAISNVGAKPIFVDIDPVSFNIDVSKIEEKISKKTKAILPVHIYGNPANMKKIMILAKKYNLRVVEDVAQAHGSKFLNKFCGTFGDFGCFSFFPSKNLGSFGDAGCVVSNNKSLINKIKKLRNHGKFSKNNFDILGFNERLDGIQAAILNVKLNYLDKWVKARIEVSKLYNKNLNDEYIIKPKYDLKNRHSFHIYAIKVLKKRNSLFKLLQNSGVDVRMNYDPPIHKTKVYKKYAENFSLPECDEISKSIICLPIYPEIEKVQVITICRIINNFFKNNS